jgi:anti-anti-sigma regulatory factor
MVAPGPTEWISVAEGGLTASRDLQRRLSTLGFAGVSTVIVDLRAVPELTTGLVAALICGYRRLSSHRARLIVLADREPVLQRLAITGLDDLLEVIVDADAPKLNALGKTSTGRSNGR